MASPLRMKVFCILGLVGKNTAVQQILHSYKFTNSRFSELILSTWTTNTKNYRNHDFVHWADREEKLYKLIELTWLGSIFFSASERGSFSSCSGIVTVENIQHLQLNISNHSSDLR